MQQADPLAPECCASITGAETVSFNLPVTDDCDCTEKNTPVKRLERLSIKRVLIAKVYEVAKAAGRSDTKCPGDVQ